MSKDHWPIYEVGKFRGDKLSIDDEIGYAVWAEERGTPTITFHEDELQDLIKLLEVLTEAPAHDVGEAVGE